MFFATVLALTAASTDLVDQYQRDWQSCVTRTSQLWANKPVPAERVVDAAFIYCRREMELFLIAQDRKNKEIGLNTAQSEEFSATLGAGLMAIMKSFAVEAVEKARSTE